MTIFSRPVHTYEHFGEEPQVIIPNFGGAESRSPRHDFLTGWVSRPRLGHMDPSSPIEKHFVLPPILYAGCQHIHILVSIASYYYAQERTRPAKEWLAKFRATLLGVLLPAELHEDGRLKLDSQILSGGRNLSVIQRQILALARAIALDRAQY